jgi:hypothetical protein
VNGFGYLHLLISNLEAVCSDMQTAADVIMIETPSEFNVVYNIF